MFVDSVLLMTSTSSCDSKYKVDNNGGQESKCQHRRSISIVEPTLTPFSYAPRSPVKGK